MCVPSYYKQKDFLHKNKFFDNNFFILLLCTKYEDFVRITDPHKSHMNWASSCTSICFFNPYLSKKRFGHFGHAIGFVGECRLICC